MSVSHITSNPLKVNEEIFAVMNKLLEQIELERQYFTGAYCLPTDIEESSCIKGHSDSIKCTTHSSAEKSKQRYGSRKVRSRQKKHKWKPYHKLTGDERRRLDERNTRRAEANHRERMAVYGLTLAPFNTTQYLMEEHERDNLKNSKIKEDYNSSEDFYSSQDDDEFIRKQFAETYDTCHESYINNMGKSDLVRELMQLEDEIETIEQRVGTGWYENGLFDYTAELKKIEVFRVEIEKLNVENNLLEKRNQMLQTQISKMKAK